MAQVTKPTDAHRDADPRRIALFTGAYNHIADGVSRTLNRLVAHLESEGFQVRVIAPTSSTPQVNHAGTLIPVPSVTIPGRPDYRISLGMTSRVRRELDAFAPHLYHIATPDLLGLQALLRAGKKGIPCVASYHTHFASYLQYYRLSFLEPVIWRYMRWFYRRCVQIYVPSESMRNVVVENGIRSGVLLWERGVDTRLFRPERRSPEWRHDRGIDDSNPTILFVSRLVWEKGLRRLVEILDQLRSRGIAFQTMIVGDGPARAELETMLPDAHFTGYLEGEDLATAYASSDIFLFPSDTESFGNVTLEAMASGLPVVCADATGNATLVDHDRTGFLVPAGSVESFADRLAWLIDDEHTRRSMGEAGRLAASSFDWTSVLRRITGYYDEILNPPAASVDGNPDATVAADAQTYS